MSELLMTEQQMWIPDISKIDGPRYLAVAGAIANAIDSGDLPPGSQLPPQRDLADRLGVTVGTIGRAYALAKKRRLVTGEVGRGTFVRGPRPEGRGANIIPEGDSRTIDLACYRSPVEGLTEAIAKAFAEVGERSTLLPLHKYPPGTGFPTHRTAGAAWIARVGLEPTPDQVLLCGGAQQAILVALSTLCTHGDTVLSENLTYSGIKALAAMQGVKLYGVATDEQGMVPEALDAARAHTSARVVYLQPSVHNPTTATMPLERRRKIAEIARKRDLILIEDDAAASAFCDRPAPVAALAPERTCYITSVSKSVSPSFRLAYVTAPPRLLERLTSTFHTMALAVSPLVAEVMALMIGNGSAEQIARKNLHELQRRNDIAAGLLKGHEFRAHPAAFFLWLSLPSQWSADEFTAAARRQGVSVVPADSFAIGRNNAAHAVRVSLNPGSNQDVLRKGIGALATLLRTQPQPEPTII